MANSPFSGRGALVTGASTGIGFEIASRLAAAGARVAIVGSRADRLDRAAEAIAKESGARPVTLVRDLAKPAAPGAIRDTLASSGFTVEVLVNNAGFGVYGAFGAESAEETLRMIDVNVRALVALTGLFADGMKARGAGWILNVASIAAFQPVPLEAAYAASKAFVLHWTEGLADELAGTGVRVTCLCPGPTDTPFYERGRFWRSRVSRGKKMSAAAVTEAGLRALAKGRIVAIPGVSNRLVPLGGRLLPRRWVRKLAQRVVEELDASDTGKSRPA